MVQLHRHHVVTPDPEERPPWDRGRLCCAAAAQRPRRRPRRRRHQMQSSRKTRRRPAAAPSRRRRAARAPTGAARRRRRRPRSRGLRAAGARRGLWARRRERRSCRSRGASAPTASAPRTASRGPRTRGRAARGPSCRGTAARPAEGTPRRSRAPTSRPRRRTWEAINATPTERYLSRLRDAATARGPSRSKEEFGRAVPARRDLVRVVAGVGLRRGERAALAEVGQFDDARGVDEEVARFDVAVHDASRVRRSQAAQRHARHGAHPALAEASPAAFCGGRGGGELRDVGLAEADDEAEARSARGVRDVLDDVRRRILEHLQRPELAQHAFRHGAVVGLGGPRRPEEPRELDGHDPARHDVAAFEHLAERALADLARRHVPLARRQQLHGAVARQRARLVFFFFFFGRRRSDAVGLRAHPEERPDVAPGRRTPAAAE
mmetsp:Transcript_3994/g.15943  ORF Transcript_3994/g.15943 Transcript_3994/m.15943 type:complete len:437 (+) Transcript_3994:1252-2562(+)